MLKRVVLFVLLVAVGAAGWLFWPERASLRGVTGPAEPYDVTILRDRWGVPHVYGVTDPDTAYGLAYAHAEDDFLTIQQSLLAARGKLASVYGRDAAPNDYLVQLLRIWDVIDAEYERSLRSETRALVEAYADGLNHYAALHRDEMLPRLFPVTGRDIVATSVHKSPLFFGLDGVLVDLFETGGVEAAAGLDMRHGSNVVAVAPGRTSDGSTFFASNSHQPWTGPVAWYEAHVHSEEGWNATGGLFPAVPVVVVGHNEDLAWSFTVNEPDLIDVYRLELHPDDPDRYRLDGRWVDFEIRPAPIEVRLAGRLRWTVTEAVLWSAFGPVIRSDDGAVAVRYAGYGEVGIYEQLYRMNKAADYEDWVTALAEQNGLASFNVGYADRHGTIAYHYNAMLPIRAAGLDWTGEVDGTSSEVIWTEYLPFERLPAVVDPAAGFVVNANSTPFQVTTGDDNPDPAAYAETFGIETWDTNRSLRARELYGSDEAITWGEFDRYKHDTGYAAESDMARFRDRIVALRPEGYETAVDLIAGWDLRADEHSRGTALMVVMLTYLVDDETVEVNPSRLTVHEPSDAQLVAAFTRAVAWLETHHGGFDVAWGSVNRLRRGDVDEGVAGAPDVLRAIYAERADEPGLTGVGGDSYIMLLRWRPDGTIESRSIHQFGSATLDERSPHYADQAVRFSQQLLKEVLFTEEEVRQRLEAEYRPGEE